MPKLKKRSEASTDVSKPQWFANVNVDLKTVIIGPFGDTDEARMESERCMKVGVWLDGKRLYPPHAIVFIEIFEKGFK